MAKRLTKDQLETDPLLTSYYIFISYLKRNFTAVIAISVAVFVLIGGGIAYYYYSQTQEQEAQETIVQIEKVFQQGEYDVALQGDGMNIGLIEFIDNYGRTRAGNLAHYYAAVAEAELGNYDEALRYIERFKPPSGILGVGPISFHAVVLANNSQFNKAADTYIKAAEWDVNSSTTPLNLLYAAQACMEADDHNRAKSLVERILNEYENSSVADEARRLEGMLIARN